MEVLVSIASNGDIIYPHLTKVNGFSVFFGAALDRWRGWELSGAATRRKRQPVRVQEEIGYLIGKALACSRVDKYFRWQVTPAGVAWRRDPERIARDAALDGIYVLRSSVPAEHLAHDQTVLASRRLASVERAFRSLKNVDLNVRPIYHRLPQRVRAHVLLTMLAYHVEWHLRQRLAPVLFDDEQHGGPRPSPVAPATHSQRAKLTANTRRTADQWPVQSFQGCLRDLATISKNRIPPRSPSLPSFDVITRPTPYQQHVLSLVDVRVWSANPPGVTSKCRRVKHSAE
jgi:hypothetical protein